MRIFTFRALVALSSLLAAPAALAHEFECEQQLGVVLDAPAGEDGLPIFAAPAAATLTLDTYPALLGVRSTLRNLAADPSTLGSAQDLALDALSGVTSFGAALASGDVFAPGAEAVRVTVVPVASYEACLALGGEPAAPVCSDGRVDWQLVVKHDMGGAECRARLVCLPQRQEACTGEACVEPPLTN